MNLKSPAKVHDKNFLSRSVAWICLILLVFFIYFKPIEIADVWWHLSVGRWIAENRQYPGYDVFSVSQDKNTWVMGTPAQATGSLVLYKIYQTGGLPGVKLFRPLFFICLLGLYYFYARNKIPGALLMITILLATFALRFRWELRPDLFNLIFIQLFLNILLNFQNTKDPKRLWIIPVLSCVWFNVHLGAFIYGSMLIGIFTLSAVIACLNEMIRSRSLKASPSSYKNLFYLFAVLFGHFAAFSLNPYGIQGALNPLKTFFDKEYIVRAFLIQSTLELQPPGFLFNFNGIFHWFFIVITAWALIKNKKGQFPLLIVFLCSFFIFLYGRRASSFFILCCLYILAECARGMGINKAYEQIPWHKKSDWYTHCFTILISILCILPILKKESHINNQAVSNQLLLTDPHHPQEAVDFLKKSGIGGNVFNFELYGGYLLWAGYPSIKPFVDSRQSDPDLYGQYLQAILNPAESWPALDRKYLFSAVIMDVNFGLMQKFTKNLMGDPQWELSFLKGSCAVFLPKNRVAIPQEPLSWVSVDQNIQISKSDLNNLSRALSEIPQENLSKEKYTYHEDMEEGLALYNLNLKNAALSKFRKAFDKSRSKYTLEALKSYIEELR